MKKIPACTFVHMLAGGDNGAGVCWSWSERESKKRQLYLLGGGMPEYILENLMTKASNFCSKL